ncbi:MAG: CAP domain-containing protein [Vicinamibacterales bacterium]
MRWTNTPWLAVVAVLGLAATTSSGGLRVLAAGGPPQAPAPAGTPRTERRQALRDAGRDIPSDERREALHDDTRVATLTNARRAAIGLPPLRVESRLSHAAGLHARQMAARGRLGHVLRGATHPRPEDRLAAAGYRWQAYAENVAVGQRDPDAVVDAWMRSSSHRANIVDPALTELGVATAVDAAGRPYYVQVFGRPR